jgi:predicted SAM-dependent methyltransferase
MDGWISVDMHPESDIQRDLKRKLPFPDNSVDKIYSSHVLEHFYHDDLIKLINDCRRILKPGGLFRAAVPNARIYIEGYIDPSEFDNEKHCLYKPAYHYYSNIDFVNFIAYMDGHHKYMFDEENIVKILQEYNFNSVERKEFDPNIDLDERKRNSIYVECVK